MYCFGHLQGCLARGSVHVREVRGRSEKDDQKKGGGRGAQHEPAENLTCLKDQRV